MEMVTLSPQKKNPQKKKKPFEQFAPDFHF
jgi:hypothetical protein